MAGKIEAFIQTLDEKGLRQHPDLTPIKDGTAAHESMVAAYAEALHNQQDEGFALPDVVIGVDHRTNKVAREVAERIGKGFTGFYSTGQNPKQLELTGPSAEYIEGRAAIEGELNVLIVDDVAVAGESVAALASQVKDLAGEADVTIRAIYAIGQVDHLSALGGDIEVHSLEQFAA
jgi:adenine/guanine phosphoribosyltransferase-like PRPP-binding protein